MRLLYNVAAVLVVILMIPAFCLRAIREKGFVNRIKQQLGFLPKHALDKVARKNCIWVHAAPKYCGHHEESDYLLRK